MGVVAVVDYGMGNVRSVLNAIRYCGHDVVLTADPGVIADACRVILPGDGAFGDAMAHLHNAELVEVLEREVLKGAKPFLGICVGMQVLARTSDEHTQDGEVHEGLGWFDAHITRIEPGDPSIKVPHMGWSTMQKTGSHHILTGFEKFDPSFYFVHSYWMQIANEKEVLGTAKHGETVTALVARDNIVATQFHPEKSQDNGIELLTNFLSWNP